MGKQGKKNFYKQNQMKSKRGEELKTGMKGILLMCDKNKEKSSVKDCYDILNSSIEEHYPNIISEQKEINNDLKLNEDNNDKIKGIKLFYNFETNCKGVVFIKIEEKFKDKIDILHLTKQIFLKSQKEKQIISKNISKFYPIEFCSKTSLTNIGEGAKILRERMPKDENTTFRIDFRSRNHSSLNKSDVLSAVLTHFENFNVDYISPKWTVFIDITSDLLCMTLIEDINLFRGCNVVNLIKTDEELKESKENLTKENLANKLAKDKINLKEDQIDLKSDDDDVEII